MAFLPNFGRPVDMPPRMGVIRPLDPNTSLPVNLNVRPALQYRSGPRKTSRNCHWMVCWDVGITGTGHTAQRRLHVLQERDIPHLTNWGPMTDAVTPKEQAAMVVIPLKVMTLGERQALEKIAINTLVKVPNEQWNDQDWCTEVLQEAVKQQILSELEVKTATDRASKVQPVPAP
ncbi:hypothetical protein EYR40_001864 [Pleurotus pulmonarius]|nr:hypothetical protein EYR40_001864 [Pleurotus pulmonarius]